MSSPLPPRLDLYGLIHKALRHELQQVSHQLGVLDVAHAPEVTATLDQLDALLRELARHLEREDAFIHTAIAARHPEAQLSCEADHADHLRTIEALGNLAHGLRSAPEPERANLAAELYQRFAHFVGDNLLHMHTEETVNNGLLWAAYTDAELLALHNRLLASIPHAEMFDVLALMARALNPHELTAVLSDIRQKSPPDAFAAVMNQVRNQMVPNRWARVSQALSLPATQH
ncbi:MAG: hypothetical protein EOP38_16340 [Rubrivivax sp.]|nr:MAG: hypothetical protein EOP38_16340 [Rubrivivax sp.]